MEPVNEKLRVDKYLWSIRIFKTRRLAAEACEKGKVKMNGQAVKPSKPVNLHEVFDIKTDARKWRIEVTGLLATRVAFSEAVLHYKDITPPEDLAAPDFQAPVFHTGKRLSKIGRPTKKQRRNRNDIFDEES